MIGSVAYWRKVLALVHGQSGIKTAGTEDNVSVKEGVP